MEKAICNKSRPLGDLDVVQIEKRSVPALRIHKRPSCGEIHYRETIAGWGACRKCGCKGFEHVIGNGWMCGNCGHKKEDHF